MTSVPPSLIWLTDRSRYADGLGTCQRSRYLGYHAGSTGYGWARKATKLPLMTGIAAHEALAPVLQWCVEHHGEGMPPDSVVRAGVAAAHEKYYRTVEGRGFAFLEDQDAKAVVREQTYLIEGMTWAWVLEVLPEVLSRGVVLEAEVDEVYVVGCTCGLGDGILEQAAHDARGCQGIGWQCRPDFLLLTHTGELEYHEFKTTGQDGVTFRDKWEVMIQMTAATLDAERRHQKRVGAIYVHGLIKGKRGQAYNPDTGKYDLGPIMQQSVFCYGYRKPAVPPQEPEEWADSYEYWDSFEQRNRRLTKAFKKTGIWELPEQFLQGSGIESRAEFWARWISPETRRKQLVLIGPLTRQEAMVQGFLEELVGEERRWQENLWTLYEKAQELGEGYWPHPEFQGLLNRLIPRSYECRRFGAHNRCQFEGVCFGREGWDDPEGSGLFIPRRPHHAAELEQAVGRGLLLPEVGLEEDAEERE